MITQSEIGLNSRSEANPYLDNGFLPLITAPMYSVVDESNYQLFLDNKIQVCLPRKCKTDTILYTSYPLWLTYSLEDFGYTFLQKNPIEYKHKVCVDTANGNMPQLHDTIRKAKEIHGDNLVIMAGNVGSVEAFVELAKTGVDYIRVGIGGGGGCNTTSNTGVGQKDLEKLIQACNSVKNNLYHVNNYYSLTQYLSEKERCALKDCKIVADGISSYINYCQKEYGFNDNGYAAINKLLIAGADLVMVGKLFAQCLESAGELAWKDESTGNYINHKIRADIDYLYKDKSTTLYVKYSGMSTQAEQQKYRTDIQQLKIIGGPDLTIDNNYELTVEKVGTTFKDIKPSEGSVQWIPIRWTLNEWLNGSGKQDESPYLMGFVNALRSMMSYTGKVKL